MGAWGPGPFDNDAAVEFLDKLRASPLRVVTKILREIALTPPGEYIEIDEGGAGWAACEIVALGFGYGDTAADDHVLDLAGKLRPKEEHRTLALEVLRRIADRTSSELGALWHEGTEGERFDANAGLDFPQPEPQHPTDPARNSCNFLHQKIPQPPYHIRPYATEAAGSFRAR